MSRATSKFRVSEIALRLFLERGYENVTVEDVAAASSVSRRTIFRYFGGKDELPFPDHAERRAQVEEFFAATADADPMEILIVASEETMTDFVSRPELVLRRYAVTRKARQVAEREVVQNDGYVMMNHRFLRWRFGPDVPAFKAMAVATLFESVHRTALMHWMASGGEHDALAEVRVGLRWASEALRGDKEIARSAQTGDSPSGFRMPQHEQRRALRHALRNMSGSPPPA